MIFLNYEPCSLIENSRISILCDCFRSEEDLYQRCGETMLLRPSHPLGAYYVFPDLSAFGGSDGSLVHAPDVAVNVGPTLRHPQTALMNRGFPKGWRSSCPVLTNFLYALAFRLDAPLLTVIHRVFVILRSRIGSCQSYDCTVYLRATTHCKTMYCCLTCLKQRVMHAHGCDS